MKREQILGGISPEKKAEKKHRKKVLGNNCQHGRLMRINLRIRTLNKIMRAKGAQGLGKLLHSLLEADTNTLAGKYSY